VYHSILLATWWRRDGTPVPDRKFFNLLLQGDPVAMAYLGAVVVAIVALRVYRVKRGH
jgi:hypothetical protein